MRQPSPEWIAAAVNGFAHGRGDDVTLLGCQREYLNDLGFGWLYFALARAGEAQRVLVQGTGRGFSAACLALAIEHRPGSMLTILDPGYRKWLVDAETPDQADGLWSDQEQVQRHFAPLGLSNIELFRERSDAGYARLRERDELFDIILIDGDHGYEQCLKDLRNAVPLLRPAGFILLHDACCPDWPGVALAIDTLQQENATLEKVVLPLYPGLCILQKTRPVVIIRPIDSVENDQVNQWRRQAGITMRPLPDGDDPRPGQSSADSRVSLFAIVCDGKLAGGFGIRPRTFCQAGADDFLPADGVPCSGFLVYGVVLRPEVRGQGVYDFVQQELLRWFGAAGFYTITDYPGELQTMASIKDVGQSGPYRAYHTRPLYTAAKPAFSLARQIEYRLRNMRTIRQIRQEVADLQHAVAEKERASRQEIANLQHLLAEKEQATLAKERASRQEIANLQHVLAEKEQATLVKERASRQEIASFQHVLAEKEQATLAKERASRQEIASLQHALTSLQQSRSWRWTTPMRRVVSFLRQVSSSGATTGDARVGDQSQDNQGARSRRAG